MATWRGAAAATRQHPCSDINVAPTDIQLYIVTQVLTFLSLTLWVDLNGPLVRLETIIRD